MVVATRTRAQIEALIVKRKAEHDRLPKHYEAKRTAIMDDVESLVDEWIAAPA